MGFSKSEALSKEQEIYKVKDALTILNKAVREPNLDDETMCEFLNEMDKKQDKLNELEGKTKSIK